MSGKFFVGKGFLQTLLKKRSSVYDVYDTVIITK